MYGKHGMVHAVICQRIHHYFYVLVFYTGYFIKRNTKHFPPVFPYVYIEILVEHVYIENTF